MRYVIIGIMLGMMTHTSTAAAEIYRYIDKNGNIVITDNPPAGVQAEKKAFPQRGVKDIRIETEVVEPQAQTNEASGPDQTKKYRKSYASVDVIMYSTPWCGYCTKARKYIQSLGVSFTEYNIEQDTSKKKEMMRKSGGSRSVPLIDIEGIIVRGYSPGRIKAAVEKKRNL